MECNKQHVDFDFDSVFTINFLKMNFLLEVFKFLSYFIKYSYSLLWSKLF